MPDHSGAVDIDTELRRYFALTTSVAVPDRVARLRAASLSGRRRRFVPVATAVAGVLAAAACGLFLATHRLTPRVANQALSNKPVAGAGSGTVAPMAYPGVDMGSLVSAGVRLLTPAGHGTAAVAPAAARAAALAAVGGEVATAGPVILAYAEVSRGPQPVACFCWVVDVALGTSPPGVSGPPPRTTELVLIDAVDGRLAAVVPARAAP